MPQPIARLTSAGNFYVQGTLDEATFDSASGFSKNFYTWSQDFRTSIPGQSIYQVYNPGRVSQWDPASAMAPDGTQTALTISNIPNVVCVVSNPNINNIGSYLEYAGGVYTKSVYAKNITGSPLIIFQYIEYANNAYATATYNLSTGVATNGSNSTAVGMYYVGNGWWRCWETITLPNIVASPYSIGDSVFIGGYGTTSLQTTTQIWGMQFERGGLTDYEATGAQSAVLPYAGTALIPPGFTTRLNPTGFATIGSFDEVSINQSSGYSQNLLSYSQQLTGAGWGLTGVTAKFGSSAPDGAPTATLITEDTSVGNSHWINTGNVYILPKTLYTLSCYYKIYSGDRQFYFTTFDAGAPGGSSYAGVVISNDGKSFTSSSVTSFFSNGTYSITPVGNGWNRVVMTFQTGPTPGLFLQFRLGLYNNGAQYYAGNGTSGLYVWGPQFELGTTATDYVPTGAGAAPIAPFVERRASTGLHRIAGAYDEVSLNPTSGYSKNLVKYSTFPQSQVSLGGTFWISYCSNGDWSNFTANTTDVAAPDGTYTALKIVRNNFTACGYSTGWGLLANYTRILKAGVPYTVSVWARVDVGTSTFLLGLNDYYTQSRNLTTQWQRFTLTATPSGAVNTLDRGIQFYNSNQNVTTYFWGPQLELGTAATDYVPTDGNAVPLA
jgi:hypothetical protein